MRFMRLRTTARGDARRPTDIPNRGRDAAGAKTSVKCLRRRRRPSENTRSNSAGRVKRASRANEPVGAVLRREARAALGASRLEDTTAGFSRHTGTETVRSLPVNATRLVRSLHD